MLPVRNDLSGMGLLGHCVGHYRLARLLGEGGMGMVFEGVHDGIGGRAAIKILRPEVAARPEIASRFFNEARAANSILHPGIVRVFDCGYAENGVAYLAMEFLAGESLRSRLDRVQRLGVSEALHIGRQIASALHAAHSQRVIHRDLKPDNLMLVPDPELASGERVKVLDFGIAKVAEELSAQSVRTQSNMLLGTPLYMAPEQCRGARHVTEKSDVYALGVILFQMLAGRLPFIGEGIGELAVMHLLDAPPALSDLVPSLDPNVARVIHSMLAKQGTARPNMEEVAFQFHGLLRLTTGSPVVQKTAALCLGGGELAELSSLRAPSFASRSENAAGLASSPLGRANEAAGHPTAPSVADAGRGPGSGRTVGEAASEVQRPPSPSRSLWGGMGYGLGAGLVLFATAAYFARSQPSPGPAVMARAVTENLQSEGRIRPDTSLSPAAARVIAEPPVAPVAVAAQPITPVNDATATQPLANPVPSAMAAAAVPLAGPPPGRGDHERGAVKSAQLDADKALARAESALRGERFTDALHWGAQCLRSHSSKCALIIGIAGCKASGLPGGRAQLGPINTALTQLQRAGQEDLIAAIHTVCAEHGLQVNAQGRYTR